MDVMCNKKGRTLIVKIIGDIDHHTAEEIRDKIDKEFNKMNARDIILDFESVSFMDSSGIGMIIGRYKNTELKGGKVVAVNINEDVARLFDISGLKKIINCYRSIQEAMNA